jgi:hypothetical protein
MKNHDYTIVDVRMVQYTIFFLVMIVDGCSQLVICGPIIFFNRLSRSAEVRIMECTTVNY